MLVEGMRAKTQGVQPEARARSSTNLLSSATSLPGTPGVGLNCTHLLSLSELERCHAPSPVLTLQVMHQGCNSRPGGLAWPLVC